MNELKHQLPALPPAFACAYSAVMHDETNHAGPHRGKLDKLTVISLAGTAAVLMAVVLLFTVPGMGGLLTAGYDTMFSAMNYMAEMCRF